MRLRHLSTKRCQVDMQPKIKTFLGPKGTNDMAQHKTCMEFNNMHDMIYENSEVDKNYSLSEPISLTCSLQRIV